MKEIDGLMKREAFEIILEKVVLKTASVMGGGFVPAIQNRGSSNEFCKTRVVVQEHKDVDRNLSVHTSCNLRQIAIWMLIAIAAFFGFCV